MKTIIFISILLFSINCKSQSKLQVVKDDPFYEKISQYNDSISKIKIAPDTITKYKIDKIVEEDLFYIIYAKGTASNGNEYLYRIKSDKNDFCSNKKRNSRKIKVGETCQLDLRDYRNHNQRLHFVPGVAFNLVTHSGFSPFDIVIYLDEKITKDEFNIALNLKGLCLIEK